MATDADIIRRSRVRPRAFEAIFDRHHEAIRGYLVRRVGRDDAEDLAADVFTTAFAHRDRYDLARENARPWLYGIATNLLHHHLRSRSRGARALARVAAQLPGPVDLEEVAAHVDADADATRALAAVDGLAVGDRDVILLVAWEGLGYREVAEALDIPVGTVRSRLHRARREVRSALAETVPGRPDDA